MVERIDAGSPNALPELAALYSSEFGDLLEMAQRWINRQELRPASMRLVAKMLARSPQSWATKVATFWNKRISPALGGKEPERMRVGMGMALDMLKVCPRTDTQCGFRVGVIRVKFLMYGH